jgi:endonuclease YncB( thermonuclease family)
MKRNILTAVLASLQLGSAFGYGGQEQDLKKSLPEVLRNDPCGDLFGVDSCTYDLFTGKVIEVIDGGTIVAIVERRNLGASPGRGDHRTGPQERRRVLLAGISVPSPEHRLGREAKQKLTGLVLERTVSLDVFCPGLYKNEDLRAIVMLGTKDVGLDLIESGLARFNTAGAGAYTSCHYRLAESRAKSEKRGLWVGQ